MNETGHLELYHRDGKAHFAAAQDNAAKINNIRKWDQAMRVYAAIYTQANPERASEIWQYVYVIHTAVSSYSWDNVAFYFTFHQLMAAKPWRSWSKTYVQGWNLAMKDAVNHQKGQHYGGNTQAESSNHAKNKSWKDYCCWRYNKKKCTKSAADCDFDHRCTYCGGWNHGFWNCRKCLRKQSGGSAGNGQSKNNTGGGSVANSPSLGVQK